MSSQLASLRRAASVPSNWHSSLTQLEKLPAQAANKPGESLHLASQTNAAADGNQPLQSLPKVSSLSSPLFSPLFDMEMDAARMTANVQSRAAQQASLDRSLSDLQTQQLQFQQYKQFLMSSPMLMLSERCKPAGSFELQLSAELKRLRSQADTKQLDIEGLATVLLASGYLVQIRDGCTEKKPVQNCLRTLRHRFLVCTGCQCQTSGEPIYLSEPLVVEPRFREQFTISNGTPAYESMLMAVPISFVGTLTRLSDAVGILADALAEVFKEQGRSLPPWRTKQAMMSKWAPAQITELAKLMARTVMNCPPPLAAIDRSPVTLQAAQAMLQRAMDSSQADAPAAAAAAASHEVSGGACLGPQAAQNSGPAALPPHTSPFAAAPHPTIEQAKQELPPDELAMALGTTLPKQLAAPPAQQAPLAQAPRSNVPPPAQQPIFERRSDGPTPGQVRAAQMDKQLLAANLEIVRMASSDLRNHAAQEKRAKSALAAALRSERSTSPKGPAGAQSTLSAPQLRSSVVGHALAGGMRAIRTVLDDPWARINTVRWTHSNTAVGQPSAAAQCGAGTAGGDTAAKSSHGGPVAML
eukprot:CAMPEP_0202911196 /NCGR_PEP_ID=MMETSP1392-20130828/54297_1 /ASSEMBLY_ACC=CAM_ASM_000868 /TAXON_ID=225041 /ORGANISM="Chlamydomonas chlamydogama, Strain SAG 11-48b" /LENGTH=583 /DNA_ID=CAMNT_0049601605 /DNA_START=154 /DNA_END=1905 /DNA_ORIENTATION=-